MAGIRRDRYGKMIPRNRHYRQAWKIVLGKAVLYLPVYLVMGYWVLFIVPRFFSLTQIAGKAELMLFLFPFLLACAFMALAASFLSKGREYPFLLFVFTSVPLMFISGISWPKEGIAWYWVAFSKVFPSTHGIDGFVKMNNMGGYFERCVAGICKSLDFGSHIFCFGVFLVSERNEVFGLGISFRKGLWCFYEIAQTE